MVIILTFDSSILYENINSVLSKYTRKFGELYDTSFRVIQFPEWSKDGPKSMCDVIPTVRKRVDSILNNNVSDILVATMSNEVQLAVRCEMKRHKVSGIYAYVKYLEGLDMLSLKQYNIDSAGKLEWDIGQDPLESIWSSLYAELMLQHLLEG